MFSKYGDNGSKKDWTTEIVELKRFKLKRLNYICTLQFKIIIFEIKLLIN